MAEVEEADEQDVGNDGDQREYVYFPEEAIQFLPKEWQEHLVELKAEGQAVLAAVDDDLQNLTRLMHALPTMASLRYIHHRLTSTKFEATMEWAFENDMLTLAFVTTYFRLIDGGLGSGVSRKALPRHLRPVHEQIISLRHQRYAHNVGHHSLSGGMVIGFENGKFDVTANFQMGFHVGGALEWTPLVEFLDSLMFDRLQKQLARLSEKSGREWSFPSGPPPSWVS